MQQQHEQRSDINTDCCYQQWTPHHQTHHPQPIANVPSPMQQMEGTYNFNSSKKHRHLNSMSEKLKLLNVF